MKRQLYISAIILSALFAVSCANNSADKSATEPSATVTTAQDWPKVYDDAADPVVQIDQAIAKAKSEGKNVICQVGGNWCRWCLMFADYITNNEAISSVISENYVYTHINVRLKDPETGNNVTCTEAMAKLGNPERFGFPVLVVLDSDGNVLHFQDSSYLEEGEGYNEDKVMRFFKNWTPSACVR